MTDLTMTVRKEISPNVWEIRDSKTGEIIGYDEIGQAPQIIADPVRLSAIAKLEKLGLTQAEALAILEA